MLSFIQVYSFVITVEFYLMFMMIDIKARINLLRPSDAYMRQ